MAEPSPSLVTRWGRPGLTEYVSAGPGAPLPWDPEEEPEAALQHVERVLDVGVGVPGDLLARGELDLGDPEAGALGVAGAPLDLVEVARSLTACMIASSRWRRRPAYCGRRVPPGTLRSWAGRPLHVRQRPRSPASATGLALLGGRPGAARGDRQDALERDQREEEPDPEAGRERRPPVPGEHGEHRREQAPALRAPEPEVSEVRVVEAHGKTPEVVVPRPPEVLVLGESPAGRSPSRRPASIAAAASSPPCIASNTPVEKIGSRNAAASPTATHRSPAIVVARYE